MAIRILLKSHLNPVCIVHEQNMPKQLEYTYKYSVRLGEDITAILQVVMCYSIKFPGKSLHI